MKTKNTENHLFEMKNETGILSWMQHLITDFERMGHSKTAQSYRNCLRSLTLYFRNSNFEFWQITQGLVTDYQYFLLSRKNCFNTVSFYMRIFRAAYNKAAKAGLTEKQNLFSEVYTGVAKTEKRAVKASIIQQLKQLDLQNQGGLAFSRDLFLLSFYFRGMAFVDLANLKKVNIQNDLIRYTRSKTKQDLRVKIEPCAKAILDRYQCLGSPYALPILKTSENSQKIYDSALRLHNKRLLKLSKMIQLEHTLSSYVARHSWATLAKRSGVDLTVISESLGHNSLATTQIYLDSLDQDRIDDANSLVISMVG